ncbi:sodium channel protein Nach-like isoform X2 [Ptiloglossa arizonensis]|uniref:sodium channel protein Nach-like isoform X2 n=1 Tax=Ptiloglossa arizonensis TaxID=3350558 RepID=UPI003F9FC295
MKRGTNKKRFLKKVACKCLYTLKRQALKFCQETGLHGYKYIAEPQRSMITRIVWAITALTSLIIALVIIRFTFNYYSQHRISTVIESTHHGVWNYPFPAVTLCDINRISLKLARALTEKLELPPKISKEFIVQELTLLNELLYPGKSERNVKYNLSRLQSILDKNHLSIPTVISSVTESCENLLDKCTFKSVKFRCSQLFESSFTRDGMCCSYNYITAKNKNNKHLSLENSRSTSCGYQNGLSITINLKPEDYYASIIGSIGIEVMLHNRYDYPDYGVSTKLIDINKYSFLTIRPEETYSTDNVKLLPLSRRNCIFSHESAAIKSYGRGDENFVTARYSFQNCMTECRTTVIKSKCGCIPYYYPQNGTRICDLRDVECLGTYKSWYDTSWPGTDMSFKNIPLLQLNTKLTPCGCKPDCDFYRFFMENSMGNLHKHFSDNDRKYMNHFSKNKIWKNQSAIHIFFGDLVSIQYRRDVRYNWRHIFEDNFHLYVGCKSGVFKGVRINKTECVMQNIQNLISITDNDEVTTMSWGDDEEKEILIACGVKGIRSVKVYDTDCSTFTCSFFTNIGVGKISGISRYDEAILTAVQSGEVKLWRFKKEDEILIKAGEHLNRMCHSKLKKNIIATGGYEHQLKLFDLEKQSQIFIEKNVSHDWLQLRVPIWISDMDFLPGTIVRSKNTKTTCHKLGSKRRSINNVNCNTKRKANYSGFWQR